MNKGDNMKKLIAISIALLLSMSAMAQHNHGGHGNYNHGGYYRGGGNWAGPLIGGIVLGTIISNSQRSVIVDQQPQVVIQSQPPIYSLPMQQYYQCLVQIKDPYTGVTRNEVATCVR